MLQVYPAIRGTPQRRKGDPEYFTNPFVRVVRLFGADDASPRPQLSGDPESLQVRHRAAAGKVSQWLRPTEHLAEFDDALFFHRGTRPTAIQRMIVRVDPQRQGVGNPGNRVRWLQHLARVLRMIVGIVVLHPCRDLLQNVVRRVEVEFRLEVG